MSKVFKALEQANHDRGRAGAAVRGEPTAVRPDPPVAAPPPVRDGHPAAPVVPVRPVPRIDEPRPLEADEVDAHLVSLLNPVCLAAEQYRILRHIIEQARRVDNASVFAVSSPSTGDGKTTTAINLAGALAQAPETRVLLVEADMRHPVIKRRLALVDATPGLIGAIHNTALALGDVARQCPPFNLWVLPAGGAVAAPYELLKSPRLGELLEDARRQYDYVVVDTPPLLPIPDCRIIGRHVDSFLVVVAAHKTPARLLDEALGVVPPSKNLGLVFNGEESAETTYGYGSAYAVERPRPGTNGGRPWYRGLRPMDVLLRRSKPEYHEEPWP
jgi:protein-tyrosine kinase